MRALITGVRGFAGSWLAEYLAQNTSWELFGVVRPHPEGTPPSGLLPLAAGNLRLISAELADYGSVRSLLAEVRPDCIFHLAAQAIVQRALADPEATLVNNLVGQLNMLRAMCE